MKLPCFPVGGGEAGSKAPYYLLLVFAVLSMSWGGPLFGLIQGPGPFLKACWRLQMTTILTGIGFIFDWKKASPELKQRWKGALPLMTLSGLNAALHFSIFAWSVEHTSFSHAMILSASAPTILVVWGLLTWLLFHLLTTTMGLKAPLVAAAVVHAPSTPPTSSSDDNARLTDENPSAVDFEPVFSPREWYKQQESQQQPTGRGENDRVPLRPSGAGVLTSAMTVSVPAAPANGETQDEGSGFLGAVLRGLLKVAGTSIAVDGPPAAIVAATPSAVSAPPSIPVALAPVRGPSGLAITAVLPPSPHLGPASSSSSAAPSLPGSPLTISAANSFRIVKIPSSSSMTPSAGRSGGRARAPSALHLEPGAIGVAAMDTGEDGDGEDAEQKQETLQHGNQGQSGAVVLPSSSVAVAAPVISYSRLVVVPPTKAEVIGCLLAFSGMVLLVLLSQQSPAQEAEPAAAAAASASNNIRPFSVAGDVAALSAAVVMAGNLLIGSRLRAWMPLWMYSFVSFGTSALFSMALSFLVEDATLFGPTNTNIFGWLTTPYAFGMTLAIAFVPTICGHNTANLVLSKVSPIALSTMLLLVPPIGSLYGYALGLQGKPGRGLLVGGPIILAGIFVVVTLGKRKKSK